MDRMLKVGDLARATGKTVRAIHIYEQMGLIRSAGRTAGRYRLFDERALERMAWISQLQKFGLSLTQIRDLIGLVNRIEVGCEAMGHVRELYREKLGGVRETIETLRGLESELEKSLLYLESCKECAQPKPKEACAECKREREIAKPSLVRGLHADVAWSPNREASPQTETVPDEAGSSPLGGGAGNS
ncbi:MAG: MerR family transcriptional regulator [Candidatus Eisenbacteria bacterium]